MCGVVIRLRHLEGSGQCVEKMRKRGRKLNGYQKRLHLMGSSDLGTSCSCRTKDHDRGM